MFVFYANYMYVAGIQKPPLTSQGQVNNLKFRRARCGMSVKLLLRVACIDLWFHRDGAPGLS